MRSAEEVRSRLAIPVICAPMFLVSGPDLVREACLAGVVGALPRQNARSLGELDAWLSRIRHGIDVHQRINPSAQVGPVAVNIPRSALGDGELGDTLDICARHGVDIVISAQGDPTELTRRVHDWGGVVFHDVTSLRFAEKAIAAGVDGLTCIGAGGGGHSGTISHLVLVRKVRAMFDGVVVMAGAVTDGAAIRAAEILGADLAYMGTRFIATQESMAPAAYKQMLVDGTSTDLIYTGEVATVPANWLAPSLQRVGLDPGSLPGPPQPDHAHLPDDVRPWRDIWSAGQGIDLIADVPAVAQLVARLRQEYVDACRTPSLAPVAQLVEEAQADPA